MNIDKPKPTSSKDSFNEKVYNPRKLSSKELGDLNVVTSSMAKLVKCTECPIYGNCPGADKENRGCVLRSTSYLRWIGSKSSNLVRAHELLGILAGDIQYKVLLNDVTGKGKGLPNKLINQVLYVIDKLCKIELIQKGSKVTVKREIDMMDIGQKLHDIKRRKLQLEIKPDGTQTFTNTEADESEDKKKKKADEEEVIIVTEEE